MNKFSLLVCENFEPEFKKILEKRKYNDVNLIAFPSICQNKMNVSKVKDIVRNLKENKNKEESKLFLAANTAI